MSALVPSPFVRDVLVPFLVVRSAVAIATWALVSFFGIPAEFRANAIAPVDALLRWDSVYYLDVAERSYHATSASFFPLYPALVRALGVVLPLAYSAVVVANVAYLVALEMLRRVVARAEGDEVARGAVSAALLVPTSFFLSAGYAESTYLAASLVAFLAASERRFLVAALAVWLACLARPQGFLGTTLPFVVAWLVTDRSIRGFPWFIATSVLALAQLCLLHRLSSGDPFAFLHADGVRSLRVFWGDHAPPDVSIVAVLRQQGFGPNLVRRGLNFAAIAVVLAASVDELRAKRIAHAVVGPTMLAVPLLFQRTVFDAASMARYALLAFPVYSFLARRPAEGNARRFTELLMPLVQVVLFAAFVSGIWAE